MNSFGALSLTYKTGVSSLKLEEIISKDGYNSFDYAYYVIKGRFELGEKAISQDFHCSWNYALCVMKCRFRLGEEMISKYMHFIYYCDYLMNVMGYNHE